MIPINSLGGERVWIGIGSNLLNPKKQADHAVWALSQIPMTRLLALSSFYRSKPLKKNDQPDFLNMVVVLDTKLLPEVLLDYLQFIEWRQGRVRNSVIWGSRTLDLDILLFGNKIICNSKLTVPHYDILNREFVIYPLIELDANLIIPNGKIILDYVHLVSRNGLTFWKD